MTLNERNLLTSLVKDSFFNFVVEFWDIVVKDPPVFNWHVKYLCDEVQTIMERVFAGQPKLYDLLVNVPPGSTKSTIFSQMLQAWAWTRMPHAKFIWCGYSDQVALKDAVYCRDIVQSDLYKACFPHLELRADVNSKHLFANNKGGSRWSVGVGGSVTGQHAHVLGVDDVIKPDEALSDAELIDKNRFMRQILPSRKVRGLENCVPTILIGQRLSQADPYGDMLDRYAGVGIKHINLPGELTDEVSPPELKGRYEDGILDGSRFPRSVLEEMRRDLSEFGYAAQVLQSPVPLGGGMFKVGKLNRMTEFNPRKIVRLVRSWDKAGTKDGGAWTVGALIAIDTDGKFWILDIVRERYEAVTREKLILATAMDDGREVEVAVEIEGGSGGKESAEGTRSRLVKKGFTVHIIHPTGDKESRAYEFANQVGSGNVFILERHWTNVCIDEMRYFPFSKWKDQIDALSQGFNLLFKPRVRIGGWRRKEGARLYT